MRCYYVFVHGKLEWLVPSASPQETSQPAGFFCHRYVLAADEAAAADKAFRHVKHNLNKRCEWLTGGGANLSLEAIEISEATFSKLLKPDNTGQVFYDEEE